MHTGVDIVTDERRCNPAAPPGRCKRVYAVEAGRLWRKGNHDRPGMCSRIAYVGRFTYGHIDTRRRLGRWVGKGAPTGCTRTR